MSYYLMRYYFLAYDHSGHHLTVSLDCQPKLACSVQGEEVAGQVGSVHLTLAVGSNQALC